MKIYDHFIVSRGKISRISVKVDDLFFTLNDEIEKVPLKEIVDILDKNFPNVMDLNRKNVTTLKHLFNENDTNTKFFIAMLTFIPEYKGKKFVIMNDSRQGSYVVVKDVKLPKKEEKLAEEIATESPSEQESPIEEKPVEEQTTEQPVASQETTASQEAETPAEEKPAEEDKPKKTSKKDKEKIEGMINREKKKI